MVLRELFLGNHRFDGILQQTGMSPRSLTLRLKHLIDADILEKKPYQQAPLRYDYRLTAKGLELWPVLVTLKQWGDKWHGPWTQDEPPVQLVHKEAGHPMRVQLTCTECGEPVSAHQSTARLSSEFAQDRARRHCKEP